MGINELLNKSPLHKEIVKFFHENPSSIDTPRGIATWVRGDIEKVRVVLEELANEQILIAEEVSSTTGYSYTRNARLLSMINKALKEKK